jgi:1-acyl-sn-glycerol-3-phosphate acyltransferase
VTAPPPPRPVGGSTLRRRSISIGSLVGLLVVTTVLAPLLAAVAALIDIVERRRGWPHVRLLAMAFLAMVIELVGTLGAAGTWLLFGGGRAFHTRPAQRAHFGLQRWWTGALLTAADHTLGLKIQVEDPTPAARGNVIVIGRHTSIGDAAIPAVLLGNLLRLDPRYVVKRSLMWSPCIDLVGHRLPHHFVERNADDNRGELAALRAIATGLDDHTAVVIFPEGTFFTPARRTRAIERLRTGSRPGLAAQAEAMQYVLPPRPSGTLAMLDGAPDADVVVLGHLGFEQFNSLAAIRRAVPFRAPIRVWLWRVPRAEVPIGNEARVAWLYEQWAALDRSIAERLAP